MLSLRPSALGAALLVWTLSPAAVAQPSHGHPAPAHAHTPAARVHEAAPPAIELVETAPIETTLDHPDIPEAADVWLQMVAGASRTIDLEEFYAADRPGSRLDPIIHALETAADRGVRVRFIVDQKMARTDAQTIDRIARHPGILVRRFDAAQAFGGVQHAKYFVVDGRDAYLGSQNFDWRSLEHVQELGVRATVPQVARALEDLFETDWELAGGGLHPSAVVDAGAAPARVAPAKLPHEARVHAPTGSYGFPVTIGKGADALRVSLVATPRGFLPVEKSWSLPRLVSMIDSARRTVRVQVMSYKAAAHGVYFEALEDALRRAAARGVAVQLLVSDWSKRPGTIQGLKSLEMLPGVQVKLVTIPQWSGGFIPFARVIHAKYLVVDGERAWVGTSNWERSYFYDTRDVGLIVEGGAFAARLDRFFLDDWDSSYAAEVDACATYVPPRIQ